MIYLNQAATTYPKPQVVIEAVSDAIISSPRGQYRSSAATGDLFMSCKENLGKIFGVKDTDRIFFTAGATAGANALFYGLDLKGKAVVVSASEHNSVLRPAMNLKDRVGKALVAPCDRTGMVDEKALADILRTEDNVAAVFINHCSNVTGYIQDMQALARLCHEYRKMIFADLSQSGGCIPVEADVWGLDGFIFAGHKGLYGIQGTGGYYVRPGIDLKPFMYGGTGRDSRVLLYDGDYEYEVGTEAGPAIAGLCAGTGYILKKGVRNIREYEMKLMDLLYERLRDIPGIVIYEVPRDRRGPVVSVNVRGMKPSDAAYILQNGYDITVRTGLQCAPLMHKAMGTYPEGTIRISLSDMNREEDVEAVSRALREISESVGVNGRDE